MFEDFEVVKTEWEREREKKDLKMNKSFDHVSGSFGLC